MNWFRLIGTAVFLTGAALFSMGLLSIRPITNESASIGAFGPIHFAELFLGAVLVVVGLCIAILGGRPKKLP